MDTLGWNTILFAFKWVFIGLIYFVLVFVVLAVRREMAMRVRTTPNPEANFSPGRLKVISGGSDTKLRQGVVIELKPVTSIGSQPDNDLVLRDRFVSRYHSRLRWDGVGWWVEDLGSRNGTFLNNEVVAPDAPRQVQNGGMINIGGAAFQLME
jgi:hypothetical protein